MPPHKSLSVKKRLPRACLIELSEIWKNNKGLPTISSRVAWGKRRKVDPQLVHAWFYNIRRKSRLKEDNVLGTRYELPIGEPLVLRKRRRVKESKRMENLDRASKPLGPSSVNNIPTSSLPSTPKFLMTDFDPAHRTSSPFTACTSPLPSSHGSDYASETTSGKHDTVLDSRLAVTQKKRDCGLYLDSMGVASEEIEKSLSKCGCILCKDDAVCDKTQIIYEDNPAKTLTTLSALYPGYFTSPTSTLSEPWTVSGPESIPDVIWELSALPFEQVFVNNVSKASKDTVPSGEQLHSFMDDASFFSTFGTMQEPYTFYTMKGLPFDYLPELPVVAEPEPESELEASDDD